MINKQAALLGYLPRKVPDHHFKLRVHRYNSHRVLIMGVVFLVLRPELIFQNGIPHVFIGMIAPNDAQQLLFFSSS